jgi:heme ABC exporter ATP-binding subunit CcmA
LKAADGVAGTGTRARVVELRGIRKRFGFRDVLRGVDLDVERGSVVAVFGPNGAGKSTLLRIAATLWSPSHGGGEVLGHDLKRGREQIRRRIGVVLHQSFLRDELTLVENLRFYGAIYGIGAAARGDELLERFGLSHRQRDRVGTFSQGMVKRADLARSLLHGPELWILDEPFSGLDPAGQSLLRQTIEEFAAAGGAVLLVTHRTDIGEEIAARVVRLDDGEVVESELGAGGGGGTES